MEIFKWEKWNDMREERILPLDLNDFKDLLEKEGYQYKDQHLFKKIYKPNFEYGVFYKSIKKLEKYESFNFINSIPDNTYPDRINSLVCFSDKEDENLGVDFIVLPFKEALFTINKLYKGGKMDNLKKGFWKRKIKWFENMEKTELWTDSPCLLIREDLWVKLKNQL